MDSQPSSQCKRTSKREMEGKEKQTRRLWTSKEEDALLSCMMECVSDKFRADNGFKSGFFVAVEKELQKLLPGTTLKANPNIESKVKNWKEKYGVIADATRISGFQWNYTTQSIEVDDESVWAEYEKIHPKAKGMNGKHFPMYESWQILFGKDRATGEMAEDPADIPIHDDPIDISEPMNENVYVPMYGNGDPIWSNVDAYVDLSSYGTDPGTPHTPTTPQYATRTTNGSQKPPKKKAKPNKEAVIHEAMGSYMCKSNEVLEKIADGIGYEKELSVKRTGVFKELMKLDLEMDDRFVINEKICLAEERVDTFYGLPDEVKQSWVKRVLEGKIYGSTP